VNPLHPKAFKYAYLKVVRHRGTPESIGRGVAIGCFTAFFIPFSLQMPVAFILSVRLHAARVAAILFTWVSNPLTIPFIYPLQCYIGGRIVGIPMTYSGVKEQISAIAETPSVKPLATLGSELLISFLVGGFLFGSIAAILGYYITVPWIRLKRKMREERQQRRKYSRINMKKTPEQTTATP
jgi:uncharacterized protein (DUF2062 family)